MQDIDSATEQLKRDILQARFVPGNAWSNSPGTLPG